MPPRYSTHDWTPQAAGDFDEMWADVKSPGDGMIYSVGTARVIKNYSPIPGQTALFSDEAISAPPEQFWEFDNSLTGNQRQVVVLQASNEDYAVSQGIVWQRFFNGNQAGAALHANARGISVWPDQDPADARIAICGETQSFYLPYSQDVWGNGASGIAGHGFIAVYDGTGDLKWSHLFFGINNGSSTGTCAITDVSIRVEGSGSDQEDVVTYCGISSYGGPASGNSLVPF
ncbi:MAG: hypothetical protein KDC98_04145, partial [Planctomycetes bacterium]|nr:hypothetical protein [Planctomycetota bacterium]